MGVEWEEDAIQQLRAIFERPGAAVPEWWEELAEAVAFVRVALKDNPLSLGEGREAGHRVWDAGLLRIHFQVLNDDDVVVTSVALQRR